MRRRRWCVLVAALALVGCGDDDGTPPPSSATDTTGSAPPSTRRPAASSPPPTASDPGVAPDIDPVVSLTEVTTLASPVDLSWRDRDRGLYIVEQEGRVSRIDRGGTEAAPRVVLDVTELTTADGERGLLGLAFAPSGDLAYVNYTDNDGNTVVAEYAVTDDGTFDPSSARTVITIEQPHANHNGGDLAFGPDGLLYVGMGDGGAGGDPDRLATDLSSPLGKLLRIDPTPSGDLGYTVPTDNPFVDQDGARPEIWSSGLRNPWRFSFDRATGDLWIADVGQGDVEEINVAPAADGVDAGRGLSFGWSAFEGDVRFNDDVPAEGHTAPLHTYTHGDTGGCSVSGGVRVRGGPVSALEGWYVFGDFCAGTLWALQVSGHGSAMEAGRVVELGAVPAITAVVVGLDGEVYVMSQQGAVVRLDPT